MRGICIVDLGEMDAESGALCRRFSAPFAPTLEMGLIQNHFRQVCRSVRRSFLC
jgi:hypothetical protein